MADDDVKEMYNSRKLWKQKEHRKLHELNTKILKDSCVKYTIASHECYLFRGKRNADFYPSTGRWRDIDKRYTKRGGATLFLKWLNS
jgi:hypothetical protein